MSARLVRLLVNAIGLNRLALFIHNALCAPLVSWQ